MKPIIFAFCAILLFGFTYKEDDTKKVDFDFYFSLFNKVDNIDSFLIAVQDANFEVVKIDDDFGCYSDSVTLCVFIDSLKIYRIDVGFHNITPIELKRLFSECAVSNSNIDDMEKEETLGVCVCDNYTIFCGKTDGDYPWLSELCCYIISREESLKLLNKKK